MHSRKLRFCKRWSLWHSQWVPGIRKNCIVGDGSYHIPEKPSWEFWYIGTRCEPGYTSFLPTLNFRGHNSEKRGIQAGTISNCPAGIHKVIFSDVTVADSGRGRGLGRRWAGGHIESPQKKQWLMMGADAPIPPFTIPAAAPAGALPRRPQLPVSRASNLPRRTPRGALRRGALIISSYWYQWPNSFSNHKSISGKKIQSTLSSRLKIFNRDPIDQPDSPRRRPGKIVGCTP